MHIDSIEQIKKMITRCVQAQSEAVALWHENESASGGERDELCSLVMDEHRINYDLWHVEDEARRRDVGPEVIARCKRTIDGLNQNRNDHIEKIDLHLLHLLSPLLPDDSRNAYNTETLGMGLDRLSILSLKIYHMEEQTRRRDVEGAHIQSCLNKLAVLREQHRDLLSSLLELLDEYGQGRKKPKLYCQFKMYNDPSLNPHLYGCSRETSQDAPGEKR